jgi:hypothetical protein
MADVEDEATRERNIKREKFYREIDNEEFFWLLIQLDYPD